LIELLLLREEMILGVKATAGPVPLLQVLLLEPIKAGEVPLN